MKQNYLVAVIVATALFFTGCDKQENAPIVPDGPGTEQPEEPKPEKPDKPSKPEDLDENDCIIFSDAVLEKGLLAIKPSIDLNGDGKISLSEAAEVREINLSFDAPQDSGENLVGDISQLKYFNKLEKLGLKYHKISDVTPIEGITALRELILIGNPIKTINTKELGNLEILRLSDTDVKSVDLSNTPKLTELYLSRTQIEKLEISGMANISEILAVGCKRLKEVKLSNLPAINRVDALKCAVLSSISVTGCPELTELQMDGNQLEGITLENLPKLQRLNLYKNKLTSLDVSAFPELQFLFIFDNKIQKLDLSKNPKLFELRASGNLMETVDLSANDKLARIELENMPNMKVLNIRNYYYDEEICEYSIVEGNNALEKVIADAGPEYNAVVNMFKGNSKVKVVTE